MNPDMLAMLAEVTKKAIAVAITPLQQQIEAQQKTIESLKSDIETAVFEAVVVLDGKSLQLIRTFGDGNQKTSEIELPQVVYAGVFDAEKQYQKGELVTHGGSLWHCNGDADGKPEDDSGAWTLCVKKGRDAK